MIPVDKDGRELSKAIVWLDTRAEAEADIIQEQIPADVLYKTTGLGGIDGALPAAKVLWMYRNEPDLYEKTHKFLLLEDYLIYRLTGKYVSEKSLQSSTGWYDITGDTFYDRMLEVCKIDIDKLPEVLPCGVFVGTVASEIAAACGLSEKTIITTGAMDQISSAIGVGNVGEGMCTETTGTALVVGATTANPMFDENNPITVYKHFDDKFIYMPYSNTAGMTLKWFKDKVMPYAAKEAEEHGISVYDVVTKNAATSPAGSKGVIMNELYSLGGGSYSSLWCQIKADVCKKKIVCNDYAETTSLGAAILGAVAVGQYTDVTEALKVLRITKKEFMPIESNFEAYDKGYERYKKYLKIYNAQEDV